VSSLRPESEHHNPIDAVAGVSQGNDAGFRGGAKQDLSARPMAPPDESDWTPTHSGHKTSTGRCEHTRHAVGSSGG
jgi:hypothetical protein